MGIADSTVTAGKIGAQGAGWGSKGRTRTMFECLLYHITEFL